MKHRPDSTLKPVPLADDMRRHSLAFAVVLAAIALAGYANSFRGPFVFDDLRTIATNPTLGDFWQLARDGSPAAGRPVVRFTLAANHAISGNAVVGYHVFNFVVHLAAGLALFGVVRRTLRLPRLQERHGRDATLIGFFSAAWWIAHPLQTEAVTYIVQRAESLCGLFYLLTFYGFVRAVENRSAVPGANARLTGSRAWFSFSVVMCFLGMATKEVMVTAPLLVLMYDATFVAGGLREAMRLRWRVHACLCATWLVLAWLVIVSGSRAGSAGFHAGVVWWQYALTQVSAITHYLRLSVWPSPLIFDYGTGVIAAVSQVWSQALLLGALLVAVVFALRRRSALGFLGAFLFLVLAPSSSVVPVVTQTMAEHRMYLPLAAIAVGLTCAARTWMGRRGYWLIGAMVVCFTFLTAERNADYASAISLWRDTAKKNPSNARAHYNLGIALQSAGQPVEAIEPFSAAVRCRPDYVEARDALGSALLSQGQVPAAIEQFQEAVRLQPGFASARINFGGALQQAGRANDAIAEYEAALRLEPTAADAHFNLAGLLAARGDTDAALVHYDAAAHQRPDLIDARFGMANTLARAGRLPEALTAYEAVIRERPDDAHAHANLGNVHLLLGHYSQAIDCYERALRLDPSDEATRNTLEQARALQRNGVTP